MMQRCLVTFYINMLMPKLFKHVICPGNFFSAFDKPCIPLKTSMKSLLMSQNGHDKSMAKMYGNDLMFRPHDITTMNDNINMDSTIPGSMNARSWVTTGEESRLCWWKIPIEIHNSECSKTRKLRFCDLSRKFLFGLWQALYPS
jgi:hypothetical protein